MHTNGLPRSFYLVIDNYYCKNTLNIRTNTCVSRTQTTCYASKHSQHHQFAFFLIFKPTNGIPRSSYLINDIHHYTNTYETISNKADRGEISTELCFHRRQTSTDGQRCLGGSRSAQGFQMYLKTPFSMPTGISGAWDKKWSSQICMVNSFINSLFIDAARVIGYLLRHFYIKIIDAGHVVG